jgi:hypothetical protein
VARRAWLLTLLLAAAVLFAPAAARADGDPASDVLLGENVFYPYTPPVSGSLQRALNAETTAAAKAHFPIKVALIASPVDLGVIPDLFGKPQQYADFLDQEISFISKEPLLVVMADGYGVVGLKPAAQAAAGTLRRPAGKGSDDLAQAAVAAVHKLAAADGHPVAAPAQASGAGGSNTLLVVVVVLVLAAGAAAAAAVAIRRRGRGGAGRPGTRGREA